MKSFKIILHKNDKEFIDLDATFGKIHGHGVLRLKSFMDVMNEARMEGAIEIAMGIEKSPKVLETFPANAEAFCKRQIDYLKSHDKLS